MTRRGQTLEAIKRGYTDPTSLRGLLIDTTMGDTDDLALGYFRARLDDATLLAALMPIALEGEGAGDAPWAAANVIAEFPAHLLAKHEEDLKLLSDEQWDYLNKPAKMALAKIAEASS